MKKLYIALLIPVFLACIFSFKSGPVQKVKWVEQPLIINCSGSPYTAAEVEEAMAFWEDLGYEFVSFFDDFDCGGAAIPGSISIDMAGQDITPGALAYTKVHYNKKTKEVSKAEIEVLVKKDLILEHELGHALGWKHHNKNGHIMYPTSKGIGTNGSGLEKK